MDTINPIDAKLAVSLARMKAAIDGLMALETRNAGADHLNSEKVALDGRWQDELNPVLEDLYWRPFRNGIDSAPENERSLRRWLREQLSAAAAVAALLALLKRYLRLAADLGGKSGLLMMGIDRAFHLTNDGYLAVIDNRANDLVTAGTDISLIDTTVDDLTGAVQSARQSTDSTAAALGAYIAARALARTAVIERTERPWGVASGLNWVFQKNDVRFQLYDINGVGCPEICAPLHGRIMTVDSVPVELQLPKHPGCDCIYTPVLVDWTKPTEIWVGG